MAGGFDIKFNVSIDHARFKQMFKDIGSREYPRAIQFALDETAKHAVQKMRAEMPKVLGGGKRTIPQRTIESVRYERGRTYDAWTKLTQLRSSIYIERDRSAYLKYIFGASTNERPAGDVGLARDRILIPDSFNLFYCLAVEGMANYRGGKLPDDLMKAVKDSIKGQMSDVDILFGRQGRGSDKWLSAMREMGASSRGNSRIWNSAAAQEHRQFAMQHMSLKKQSFPLPRAAAKRIAAATSPLDVFAAPDPWTGQRTYMARPLRTRDPAGGYHEFRRSDGTTARMPNMLSIAPGRIDGHVGPRRLFYAFSRVHNRPILQAPWEDSANEAYALFPDFVQRELENRLARRMQGRSY